MHLIDFEKSWSGDSMSVVLSQKQRAVLLQLATMLANNPAFYWLNYNNLDAESVTDFTDNMLFALLNQTIPPPTNLMQTSFLLDPVHIKRGVNDAGVQPTFAFDANALHGYYVRQNPAALNDQCHYSLFMEAGSYKFRHIWHRQTTCGILGIGFILQDGGTLTMSDVTALDMRGTLAYNQITEGNIEIPVSGNYRMIFSVHSTSLGSNYFHIHSGTYLWRQEAII